MNSEYNFYKSKLRKGPGFIYCSKATNFKSVFHVSLNGILLVQDLDQQKEIEKELNQEQFFSPSKDQVLFDRQA